MARLVIQFAWILNAALLTRLKGFTQLPNFSWGAWNLTVLRRQFKVVVSWFVTEGLVLREGSISIVCIAWENSLVAVCSRCTVCPIRGNKHWSSSYLWDSVSIMFSSWLSELRYIRVPKPREKTEFFQPLATDQLSFSNYRSKRLTLSVRPSRSMRYANYHTTVRSSLYAMKTINVIEIIKKYWLERGVVDRTADVLLILPKVMNSVVSIIKWDSHSVLLSLFVLLVIVWPGVLPKYWGYDKCLSNFPQVINVQWKILSARD